MEAPPLPPIPDEQVERVHRLVRHFLPPEYDRDFIATEILLHAWQHNVPLISVGYVRYKCIDAWRSREAEKMRNEGYVHEPSPRSLTDSVDEMERKLLVEEIICHLTPLERKLIWMKFWKGMTLEEIAEETGVGRQEVQMKIQVALYTMKLEVMK